ncbi:MAG: adenosine deaminase [Pseudorhodoplanes sp.]
MRRTLTTDFPNVSDAYRIFLAGLPKAELHLHIEGTLTPELKWQLAERNKVALPYQSIEALRDAQAFEAPDAPSYLRKFIQHYNEGMAVLRTARDFHDITLSHLKQCRDENVRYVEIMFDPQPHLLAGIAFAEFFEGMNEARRVAARDFDVESNFILSINRDRPLDTAHRAMDEARPFKDRIAGFGLDSVEEGNPPEKFVDLYDRARSEGYRLTAHCDVDQADAVGHIRDCLDLLKVERIDHGINAIEDEALVDRLRERSICLTACPTWRPIDQEPRRVDRIRKMYDLGLTVTVNTDDPGIFLSGSLATLLPPVAATGNFTPADMARFMVHAFESAWLPADKRARYVREVEDYVAGAAAPVE